MSGARRERIERLRVLRDGELQRRELLRERLTLCDNRLGAFDALLDDWNGRQLAEAMLEDWNGTPAEAAR